MKKTIKRYKKIEKKIKKIEHRIENAIISNYYLVFGTESEREKDIKNLKKELKELLSDQSKVLDTLNQKINLKKALISEKERSLTLELNKDN